MRFHEVRIGEEAALVVNGRVGTYLKLAADLAVEVDNPHRRGRVIRIAEPITISGTAPVAECVYCYRPLLGGGFGFFVHKGWRWHRACRFYDTGHYSQAQLSPAAPDSPDRDGRSQPQERVMDTRLLWNDERVYRA